MANIAKFIDHFYGHILLKTSNFEQESLSRFSVISDAIGGWSSPQILNMLNFAVSCLQNKEEYLEIGTYCGKSLIGTLYENDVHAQVIDNFWEGIELENTWNKTIDTYNLRDRITFYKINTEDWIGNMPEIGVFFYDGSHDSGHTYEALKKYEQYLANQAIVIVDDYYIFGGDTQKVYPGHLLDLNRPVKTDVDKFCESNKNFQLLGITRWGQSQAVFIYER